MDKLEEMNKSYGRRNKKAYMDWSEKGVSYLNCMYVYDTMMDVDEALQTCDTILDEIDLGIDYTSRKKDIDRLLEGMEPFTVILMS